MGKSEESCIRVDSEPLFFRFQVNSELSDLRFPGKPKLYATSFKLNRVFDHGNSVERIGDFANLIQSNIFIVQSIPILVR